MQTAVTTASPFSSDERNAFNTEGFVIVRALAGPELCTALRDRALEHLAVPVAPVEYEADTHYPGAPASRDVAGGRTVRRLLQAYSRDPLYRQWATSPAVVSRIRQLLGPAIALSQAHHNCVMTKSPAFSSVTGWHQDIRYWSFERPDLVSAWLALGPEREDNGCLRVIPGSHRMELPRDRYDDALFLRGDLDANRALLDQQEAVELDAGDVLFFHARLLHAAGRNATSLTKLAAVFTYHAGDNAARPGTRSSSLPDIRLA